MSSLTHVRFEVAESQHTPGEFVVEAVGQDGEVYVAIFAGPDAEARAREYADWKSRG